MKRCSLVVMAVFLVGIALLSGGCAKKKVAATPAAQAPAPSVEQVDRGAGMGAAESLDSRARADQYGDVLEGRTTGPMLPIYFEFDQYNVREDQRERMRKNAEYLSSNSMRIRIEGNCDERGTNEYNMALGERRAVSAKKYLVNLGVSADRLETISYGEEKPLNFGHDDLAWSQNRRADFVAIR